jgi:molybdopterin synthase catalytic subunit
MTDFIKITPDPLQVDQICAQVTTTTTGATSIFVGTTRDNFKGKKVVSLEYESYIPMAEKKMKELCNRLRVKWPILHNIAIYHRLGLVGPCEASVIIAASSPHRQEAVEAVQFAIFELKATVPIWKKELYEDGSEWKENKECDWKTSEAASSKKAGQVDPSLVQINVSNEEMDERINRFVATKRDEIDSANILEFCGDMSPDETSCARTDSVLVKKRDSTSHLRKSVVTNQIGPGNPPLTSALDERLHNMEEMVVADTATIPKDVYARIKALEDRMLLLERVKPRVFEDGTSLSSDDFSLTDVLSCGQERKDELQQSLKQINTEIEQIRNELLSQAVVKQEIVE